MVIGFLVLVGWMFDIPTLRNVGPDQSNMKANAALAFILGGLSLWLLTGKQRQSVARLPVQVCATIVLLIAVSTLAEYLSTRDFGIDQILVRDNTTPIETFPGRMSPATAINFLLMGCALLLLSSRRGAGLSEYPTTMALIIAGAAVIGHFYGVSSLFRIGIYASMALHTALTFILLGLGILSAQPAYGIINILTNDSLASLLARRLLPAAIGIPIVVGWLVLMGERIGYFDNAFGLALFALSNIIVLSALIGWHARALQQMEVEHRQAETALGLSEQRSHALIENSWDGIALFGADGTILYGSPSTSQILGYALDEFVGRNAFELIHEDDQALVTERLALSLQQPGEHISFYTRVRHKNGEWRWLEGVFTNLLDEPSVKAIVNNYHDFTERKQAEAALMRAH